jgi:hypothetical protein
MVSPVVLFRVCIEINENISAWIVIGKPPPTFCNPKLTRIHTRADIASGAFESATQNESKVCTFIFNALLKRQRYYKNCNGVHSRRYCPEWLRNFLLSDGRYLFICVSKQCHGARNFNIRPYCEKVCQLSECTW